ncbi:MAG TPA: pyridoxal-phosphate dependent enzyme, partial [Candidatus Thermoplasmatota archaeon]
GPEIWRQTEGKITHLVAGMGTGGTISGAAKYLKEHDPRVTVVGIDPEGSILAKEVRGVKWTPGEAVPYFTEGTGEDFVPKNLLTQYIDDAVTVSDKEAFLMGRRMAREEGIFCGGSSGSAVHGALKYARDKRLGKDALIVVILPDAGEIYLSKMYSDDWMKAKGFL